MKLSTQSSRGEFIEKHPKARGRYQPNPQPHFAAGRFRTPSCRCQRGRVFARRKGELDAKTAKHRDGCPRNGATGSPLGAGIAIR